MRRSVALPMTLQPLAVNRPVSVEAVNAALASDRLVMLSLQKNDSEEPTGETLHSIGTIGAIRQMARGAQGLNIILEGVVRARIDSTTATGSMLRAHVTPLPDATDRSVGIDAYVRRLHELVDRALSLTSALSQDVKQIVAGIEDPLRLAYLLGSLLDASPENKQRLLETDPLVSKLEVAHELLSREVEVLELKGKIESQAQQEMTDAQRQYYLRQQLKAIQNELGEGEGREIAELRERLISAALPEHVQTAANRELDRLGRMTPASPEYQMLRTYIDWVLDVPWSTTTEDRLDPVEARRTLDEDHHDLDRVKERIVEYLAVRKLKGDMKGPILCFVGPPGVGKTSLGQSIARAMGRKFVRISLGGVRDEAEIRGHRRTYIGSMPGRIVQALRQAGSMNPVFMLDELDKMAAGFQGDPAAALLEVLDPAQNHGFRDHFLEVTVDLSRVLFIATANQVGTLHPALLDRMEILSLSGYTEEEKAHIARRYLIPRQLSEHGLPPAAIEFAETALRLVIDEYTREAGVRNLERQIGTIARKVATRVAGGQLPTGQIAAPSPQGAEAEPAPAALDAPAPSAQTLTVVPSDVEEFLGLPRFRREVAFRTSRPGVATGVAWTETGGDVLFIEASLLPNGKETIILTGQLGNVMQESARAALSHIRANARELGVAPKFLEDRDLHVHVPAGAIPKDGPSAGVTIATAILSAARQQPVRDDVAMTGEITLTGLVLPVGGIREKALAARRMGLRTFVLPAMNGPDLTELPPDLRADMTFVPVRTLEEVLRVALPVRETGPLPATPLVES